MKKVYNRNISEASEKFVSRAIQVHGNKYDYGEVVYINSLKKVKIKCRKHGLFEQRPHDHVNGCGCPKCKAENNGNKNRKSKEDFIKEASEIHGHFYDYSEGEYTNSHTPYLIICPIHGEFMQRPSDHIKGQGCPKCAIDKRSQKLSATKDSFIIKAKAIHGDFYDYSLTKYINRNTYVNIICPIHGIFKQKPSNHIKGQGCPKCGYLKISKSNQKGYDAFIKELNNVFGEEYSCYKDTYVNLTTTVKLNCSKHGDFYALPYHLLEGHKCPHCARTISHAESELADFIEKLGFETQRNSRIFLENGQEIDILIPSMKIAIEYDGIRWHSEGFGKGKWYHFNKTKACEENGYRLIHVFESEWILKRDLVKDKLLDILQTKIVKIDISRDEYIIKEIGETTANDFLCTNHLNGFIPSTKYIGAIYNNELMAVMSLKDKGNLVWEITQNSKKVKYNLNNAEKELFDYFVKNNKFVKIIAYSDKRWEHNDENNLYHKLGFVFNGEMEPTRSYIMKNGLVKIKEERLNDYMNNERFIKANIYSIWNCGFMEYVFSR